MKQFLSFLLLVFLASCTSNTIYKKPENLIPKDSMMNLLTDMYLASSAKNIKNKFLKREENYMMLIYEKHRIDSTRFNISNNYYTTKPEEYNKMLLEVKERIATKNASYDKQLRVLDSTKREEKLEKKKLPIKELKALEKELQKE